MPFETPNAVKNFYDSVNPKIALIMETEIWPNLYHECGQRKIPLVLVSARISSKSVDNYRRFLPLFRETLSHGIVIAAQSETDAERFRSLGAAPERTWVTGNIKFDIEMPDDLENAGKEFRRDNFEGRPVWIAASTHEGEDELLLDVFAGLRKQFPGCLLVITPRHPERFETVAALCLQHGYQTVLRSEHAACTPETAVYVADTMGELPLLYAASDVAFVGGSLVRHGGHNLLEPAALGIPVVTGPHVFNFQEITDLLVEAGAAVRIENTEALLQTLAGWLGDANERHRVGQQGRQVVERNRGALQDVMAIIDRYL